MSRSVPAVSGFFIALLLLPVQAAGQAAVEAGLGAAASSTGAAGAKGVGKAIGGIFQQLDETLKPAASRSTAKPAARRAPAGKTAAVRDPLPPAATPPAPTYEDPLQIQKGIASDELLRRFGPPAMQIAGADDLQTMTYIAGGAVVQLELQAGKVISVSKPAESRQ